MITESYNISIPEIIPPTPFPKDIKLSLPEDSHLPLDQQHFLLFIPWEDKYFERIPQEYRAFFKEVLPHLHARTTDVHTAICLDYLDELIENSKAEINTRVLAIALILHDSGWSRLTQEEIASSLGVKGLKLTEKAMGPKEKHAVEGAEIARKILSNHQFDEPLSESEKDLVIKCVLFHDKPEMVAGSEEPLPLEVQYLVDLDHIWSFTHENFWQDTLRKGVEPREYLRNLSDDLNDYFVTEDGKALARKLLEARRIEIDQILEN